jgi:2-phosphosulfolactate phosphatase
VDIHIESLPEGAAQATGAVAIIDVFRAFTSAAVVLAGGATHITMVGSVEEAMALRAQGRGDLCIGEVHGRAPEGFDFGNSPFELSQADLRGKAIIQRTTNGTQGILAAAKAAKAMYAASLVTASATAKALVASGSHVTLVAMGQGGYRTSEDEICALHLRNLLEGRPGDHQAVKDLIMSGREIQSFANPDRPWMNPNDPLLALDIDRYDFAIRVKMENCRPTARLERP